MLRNAYKILTLTIIASIVGVFSIYVISRTKVIYYFDENETKEVFYSRGSIIDPLPVENRIGKYFDGWYKDSNYSVAWDFDNEKIYFKSTLYAKWGPAYTLTINNYGISRVVIVKEGQSINETIELKDPIKVDCTTCIFIGWYNRSTSFGENASLVDLDEPIYSNVEIYAHFNEIK